MSSSVLWRDLFIVLMGKQSCAHTFISTSRFCDTYGLDFEQVKQTLMEKGAKCDCTAVTKAMLRLTVSNPMPTLK